jgi:AcrR family transcriptional regulator
VPESVHADNPRPSRRARREPLSRERVLEAALAIADVDGLEALTMRGLARTLGVEPMSLYHYAAGRDEIVDAIVDRVVEEIELPASDGGWKAAIRASAISAHEVLRRHPWACNPLMAAPRISVPRLRQVDALLARLSEAALPADLADLVYHALDSHILGFTLWQAGYTRGFQQLPDGGVEAFLREIHIEDYPHLAAHAAFHFQPSVSGGPTAFEFGLDLILDGVERRRDAGIGAPS